MNIILGGTSGLGLEIAHGLQARGEETFIMGRSYDQVLHGEGMIIDLASENLKDYVTEFSQVLGGMAVNGFYWVAGKGYNGDFASQEGAYEMALANFANVVPIAQAVWQKMLTQTEPSHFVVISSTTGEKARPDEAVYAGTKHAQVGYARSLGLESERLDTEIRVALFMPGGMQTPFWNANRPAAYDEFLDPAKVADRILERVFKQKNRFYEETIPKGSL